MPFLPFLPRSLLKFAKTLPGVDTPTPETGEYGEAEARDSPNAPPPLGSSPKFDPAQNPFANAGEGSYDRELDASRNQLNAAGLGPDTATSPGTTIAPNTSQRPGAPTSSATGVGIHAGAIATAPGARQQQPSFVMPEFNAQDIAGVPAGPNTPGRAGMRPEAALNFFRAAGGQPYINRTGVNPLGTPAQQAGSVDFFSPTPGNPGGTNMTASITPDGPNKRKLVSQYGTGSVEYMKYRNWATDPDRKTVIDGKTYKGPNAMRDFLEPIAAKQQEAAKAQAVAEVDKANPGHLNANKTAPGAVPGDSPYQSLTDPDRVNPSIGISEGRQRYINDLGTLNLPARVPAPKQLLSKVKPAVPSKPATLPVQDDMTVTAATPGPVKMAYDNPKADPNSLLNVNSKSPVIKTLPAAPAAPATAAPTPTVDNRTRQAKAPQELTIAPTTGNSNLPQYTYDMYHGKEFKVNDAPGFLPSLHQNLDMAGEHLWSGLQHAGRWVNRNVLGGAEGPIPDWRPAFEKKWNDTTNNDNEARGILKDESYIAPPPTPAIKGAALTFALQCAKFASAILHTPTGLEPQGGLSNPKIKMPIGPGRPKVQFTHAAPSQAPVTPLTQPS